MQIFHALNAQDLPEYFEDNIGVWMPALLELFNLEPPVLKQDDSGDDPGKIEILRASICEAIAMCAQYVTRSAL